MTIIFVIGMWISWALATFFTLTGPPETRKYGYLLYIPWLIFFAGIMLY